MKSLTRSCLPVAILSLISCVDDISPESPSQNGTGGDKDTTPPVLQELSTIGSVDTATPIYTFTSSETGLITYGGGCSSTQLQAFEGENQITFEPLSNGIYSDCVITVTDTSSNSAFMNVSPFTINADVNGPVLSEVAPIGVSATDRPEYVFSSNEQGWISYSGSCYSPSTTAVIGNNTITLSALENGVYDDCLITVTDSSGNYSNLNITTFTIAVDTTPPVLSATTVFDSVVKTLTPSFTFTSSEAGSLLFEGNCSSVSDSVSVGENTIVFDQFNDQTTVSCTLKVIDPSGNTSELTIADFLVSVITSRPLNDTGIDLCGDYAYSYTYNSVENIGSGKFQSGLLCSSYSVTQSNDGYDRDTDYDSVGDIVPAGQDAVYGRDVDENGPGDDEDGVAGFSFTKLDALGNELDNAAASWSCVRDNVTELVWEVKSTSGNEQDKAWTYSWYNNAFYKNGGDAGTSNTGNCSSNIDCDTYSYRSYINSYNGSGLCGFSDWRMPEKEELLSIVNNGSITHKVDMNFFPNTFSSNGKYWTATPYAGSASYAWAVDFEKGDTYWDYKYYSNLVRLVRSDRANVTGSGCSSSNSRIPVSKPDKIYEIHDQYTVTDKETGLMWQRTSVSDKKFTWLMALKEANANDLYGYSDWRLPNKNELMSLVDSSCVSNSINRNIFTLPIDSVFWTSSPYRGDFYGYEGVAAWAVDFESGDVHSSGKLNELNVILVRDAK